MRFLNYFDHALKIFAEWFIQNAIGLMALITAEFFVPIDFYQANIKIIKLGLFNFLKQKLIYSSIFFIVLSCLYALGLLPTSASEYYSYVYENFKATLTLDNAFKFVKQSLFMLIKQVVLGIILAQCTIVGLSMAYTAISFFVEETEDIAVVAADKILPKDYINYYAPILEEIGCRVNVRLPLKLIATGYMFLTQALFDLGKYIFGVDEDAANPAAAEIATANHPYQIPAQEAQVIDAVGIVGAALFFSQSHAKPIQREIFIYGLVWGKLADSQGIVSSIAAHMTNNFFATSTTAKETLKSALDWTFKLRPA